MKPKATPTPWFRPSVEKLAEAGVKAHGEVRTTLFGYAARDIVDDAIEHDADVIVMGSRGRSDLAGFILGSTAHKVIHLTDRPVLIVRTGDSPVKVASMLPGACTGGPGDIVRAARREPVPEDRELTPGDQRPVGAVWQRLE